MDLTSGSELKVEQQKREVERVVWTRFTTHLVGLPHPGTPLMFFLPTDPFESPNVGPQPSSRKGAQDAVPFAFVRVMKSCKCI